MLVEAFPACGLGVSVATDGSLHQTEVFAASHSPAALTALHAVGSSSHGPASSSHSHHSHGRQPHAKPETQAWGDCPMLLLIGTRLGQEGVNPVYHETIKVGFSLHLFLPEPFHARRGPFLPRLAPLAPGGAPAAFHWRGCESCAGHGTHTTHAGLAWDERRSLSPEAYARGRSMSLEYGRAGSELYARGGLMSPEYRHGHAHGQGQAPMTEDRLLCNPTTTSADYTAATTHAPAEAHFARAYSTAELRTFHCECVRKMSLTGLDPSMLIGFVCRNEVEWVDLRRRIAEVLYFFPFLLRFVARRPSSCLLSISRPFPVALPRPSLFLPPLVPGCPFHELIDSRPQLSPTIFIQDEPPTWGSGVSRTPRRRRTRASTTGTCRAHPASQRRCVSGAD
ncbi:hypothetical protein B0H10DRAFT_1991741 [Mycena sp. CBHHK59/15]|nr:hypothetical protein B0H10DRAFT_1991741 [Mycena sp. CBHHK59/15]